MDTTDAEHQYHEQPLLDSETKEDVRFAVLRASVLVRGAWTGVAPANTRDAGRVAAALAPRTAAGARKLHRVHSRAEVMGRAAAWALLALCLFERPWWRVVPGPLNQHYSN